MDSKTFREAAHRAVEYIAEYYDTVSNRPVRSDFKPGYLVSQLPSHAPESSEGWDDIESDLRNVVEPGLCHWTHPNFMAYFPASSTFEGILGELYSAAFNNPAFDWVCSPAITEMEIAMVEWVADLLGLPEGFRASSEQAGFGAIMGSTTECLITTMCSARDKAIERLQSSTLPNCGESDPRNRLVVLSSSETHVSTKKAAGVVGVRHHRVQCDPTSGTAMTGPQLQEAIDLCLSQGLVPIYATVTFGTTNSCAIDDFASIAEVKKHHPEIWIHVDAAYAGAALACEEYRELVEGIDSFDSFSINMGKWLLTNLDCTMLFARRQTDILSSMKITYAILENDTSRSHSVTDFRNMQLSMGRRFRSLKIWFVLRSWGKTRIREHLRRHIAMAALFTQWVRDRSDLFTLAAKPQFALNIFRVSDEAASRMGTDSSSATLRLYNVVNENRDVWVSKTVINGCTSIRVLAANTKSSTESLRVVFDALTGALNRLLSDEALWSAQPSALPSMRTASEGFQEAGVQRREATLLAA